MSKIIIKAENVSKCYNLGKLGSGRLREDFKVWWERLFRAGASAPVEPAGNRIWALKDINFEVSEGEVLGFIGNNGAGKSTLLRIISRITAPTSGTVMGRGRVVSLLEIGAGFHGELTGRENVFLNGHILGMKKHEITEKLDEIIDFSGVDKFIDTPVKRYSSGMYMRLAFAVAAHLEPEVLIVDEVLAVGDAEFQRKCISKMKEISAQKGKTVLFVSHHTQALQQLCHRIIVLDKGHLTDMGEPGTVIRKYLDAQKERNGFQEYEAAHKAPGNEHIRIKKAALIPHYINGQDVIDIETPVTINFECWYVGSVNDTLIAGVHLFNGRGECIFELFSESPVQPGGMIEGNCTVPGNFLNDGSYYISLSFQRDYTTHLFYFEACLSFDVEDHHEKNAWQGKRQGYVRPAFPFILKIIAP